MVICFAVSTYLQQLQHLNGGGTKSLVWKLEQPMLTAAERITEAKQINTEQLGFTPSLDLQGRRFTRLTGCPICDSLISPSCRSCGTSEITHLTSDLFRLKLSTFTSTDLPCFPRMPHEINFKFGLYSYTSIADILKGFLHIFHRSPPVVFLQKQVRCSFVGCSLAPVADITSHQYRRVTFTATSDVDSSRHVY